MAFVAGPYTWTYDAGSFGIAEDAPSIEYTLDVDPITGDNMGSSVQDGVYRGGNCYLNVVIQEYDAAKAAACFWPYGTTFGILGTVGVLMSAKAKVLVGTAVAGTTASSAPATLTANKAVLAPGYPVRMLFGTRLRNIPIRFQLLPFVDTGVTYFFKLT